MVERDDPGPLGSPAGTVAVKGRRSARQNERWKNLPTVRGVVEDRFLFNVHLGSTVFPFRTIEPELAVLPWTGQRLLAADDAELDRWPGFASWWRQANEHWVAHRPTSGQSYDLGGWLNYHGKLTAQGDVLDDLRVVYPKSGQYLAAALVEQPRTFIDHKLYWCRVRSREEGRYLTAVLNAPVIQERLTPLQARGEHNPRDIDKYVWALPIPRFDERDEVHCALVGLAEHAEQVAADVELEGVRFETGRRHLREALVESGIAEQLNEAVDTLLLRASGAA